MIYNPIRFKGLSKLPFLSLFIFIFSTCTPSASDANRAKKKSIDALPFNKSITKLELNNFEEIIDTASISLIKEVNGKYLYQKKSFETEYGKGQIETYYTVDEDIFLQFSNLQDNSYVSTYEGYFNKDGELFSASMISEDFEEKSIDTLIFEVSYDQRIDGTKKQVRTEYEYDNEVFISLTQYNNYEKAVFASTQVDNDTLEKHIYFYKEDTILQKIEQLQFYGDSLKSTKYYNTDKKVFLLEETSSSKDSLIYTSTKYEYNEDQELTKTTTKSTDKKEESIYKYIIKKL